MTPARQAILDLLGDETVMFFEPEGLDAAIIGLSMYQPTRAVCVVYDYEKVLAYYVSSGMSEEDAEEWVSFNTLGAWVGETTPIVVNMTERENHDRTRNRGARRDSGATWSTRRARTSRSAG